MSIFEEKVEEFQRLYNREVSEPVTNYNLLSMRKRLIDEEYKELDAEIIKALDEIKKDGKPSKETLAHMYKEMADLQYVLSGLSVTFGIPIDTVFSRVHDSNLSKLGADGKPIYRDDGKILKGPNYFEPKLDDLVD